MYLPKAVEGAYSTLKFKPKTRKKECWKKNVPFLFPFHLKTEYMKYGM